MAFYANDYKQDMTPTTVRVVRPVWIHGEPRKVGDQVTVGRQDAIDMAAQKRVEIVSK